MQYAHARASYLIAYASRLGKMCGIGVKVKVKSPIVNSALSQLCDLRDRCSSLLTGLEPAVSCKHSSVTWAVGHTSPIYCRYLPSG